MFYVKDKPMKLQEVTKTNYFTDKTTAMTGGGGVLCSEMAKSSMLIVKS
jgi:hypothetical protein